VALNPAAQTQLLSTYDEKLRILKSLQVDIAIEEPFSREFSTILPEQFFKDVLLRQLSAEAIVVGYDFGFGRERKGQLDVLESLCKQTGISLTVIQPRKVEGEVASSSRIRQHLLSGQIEAASHLLGRHFSYRGVVVKGDGRGRKIGFPTANLKLENKLALPYGVYATWTQAGDRRLASVTNVGVRPTFQTAHELPAIVETHLLDQTIDLYGSELEVQFVKKLRDEKKFSGIDELKKQISLDIQAARQILLP
jgi:riboflavin kinase/FMN adenylyltransferase